MTVLDSRHALVTGGGSGIGAAVALALAAAGARVTICGRRAGPLDEVAAGYPAIQALTCDVTREDEVAGLFDVAAQRFGAVDIVVANAGAAQSASLETTSMELWNLMLAVNLTGVFLTLREALRQMKGRPWGRLVSIASSAGLEGFRYVAAYSAAKHGVVGLTRSLALETAGRGITVNAVCPGFTETPMLAETIQTIIEKTGASADQARSSIEKMNPGGRLVRPGEVADAVMRLVGDGSDAITGQAIPVLGGDARWPAPRLPPRL